MSKKDWKKTIFRMKQLADQNLGRAEKSEVLSDGMRHLEKRVDLLKMIHHSTSQRLTACLPPPTSSSEKRLRKMPESGLARSFTESAEELGDLDTLGKSYQICADVHKQLARELLLYVQHVEKEVLKPIQAILENEIPSINRLRKQLSKLTLDMDSAKGRYMSAVKQASRERSPPLLAKVESAREEVEQTENKVNQCRDMLSTEIYSFFSKEGKMSDTLLRLLTIKINYHRQSLELLQQCLPDIQRHIENSVQRPVYGCSLEIHLKTSGRRIAFVIEQCVRALLRTGVTEEGLFRVTSSTTRVKKLKAAFDANMAVMEEYDHDPHCVAGALKMYLRELPEPIMTFELYDEWVRIVNLPDELRQNALWVVVDKMPKANYENLSYIIKFLAKLAENSDENKMSATNLAIVIGPSLLWPANGDGPSIISASNHSSIVEWLIKKSEWFFPGELDFGIPEMKLDVAQNRRRSSSPYNGALSRIVSHSFRDLSSASKFESDSSEPSPNGSNALNPRTLFFEGKPPFGPSASDHNSDSMYRSGSWRSRGSSLTDGSLSGSANSLIDGTTKSRHTVGSSLYASSIRRVHPSSRQRDTRSYNGTVISVPSKEAKDKFASQGLTAEKSQAENTSLSAVLFPGTDFNRNAVDDNDERWKLDTDVCKSIDSTSIGQILSGESGDTWLSSSSASLPIVTISSPRGSSSEPSDQLSPVFLSRSPADDTPSVNEQFRRASSWSEAESSSVISPCDSLSQDESVTASESVSITESVTISQPMTVMSDSITNMGAELVQRGVESRMENELNETKYTVNVVEVADDSENVREAKILSGEANNFNDEKSGNDTGKVSETKTVSEAESNSNTTTVSNAKSLSNTQSISVEKCIGGTERFSDVKSFSETKIVRGTESVSDGKTNSVDKAFVIDNVINVEPRTTNTNSQIDKQAITTDACNKTVGKCVDKSCAETKVKSLSSGYSSNESNGSSNTMHDISNEEELRKSSVAEESSNRHSLQTCDENFTQTFDDTSSIAYILKKSNKCKSVNADSRVTDRAYHTDSSKKLLQTESAIEYEELSTSLATSETCSNVICNTGLCDNIASSGYVQDSNSLPNRFTEETSLNTDSDGKFIMKHCSNTDGDKKFLQKDCSAIVHKGNEDMLTFESCVDGTITLPSHLSVSNSPLCNALDSTSVDGKLTSPVDAKKNPSVDKKISSGDSSNGDSKSNIINNTIGGLCGNNNNNATLITNSNDNNSCSSNSSIANTTSKNCSVGASGCFTNTNTCFTTNSSSSSTTTSGNGIYTNNSDDTRNSSTSSSIISCSIGGNIACSTNSNAVSTSNSTYSTSKASSADNRPICCSIDTLSTVILCTDLTTDLSGSDNKDNALKYNTRDNGTEDNSTKYTYAIDTQDVNAKEISTKDCDTNDRSTKDNSQKENSFISISVQDNSTKHGTTEDIISKDNTIKISTTDGKISKDNGTKDSTAEDITSRDSCSKDSSKNVVSKEDINAIGTSAINNKLSSNTIPPKQVVNHQGSTHSDMSVNRLDKKH